MALQPGQTILNGKYRILQLIGEGGMARVWRAEELTLDDRWVAIKEPRSDLSADAVQDVNRRYEQEVRLCGALEQARIPNIVRALTSERYEGQVLLVLEYMPGGDLETELKQHPGGLSIERAVSITLDLLQALEEIHAHRLEIVHRDIKPSNVLFDMGGKAHLADFGLAQLAGVSDRSKLRGRSHPGTPGYMAPEQEASPRSLTPAADLFAVGCILFEMLTGQRYQRQKPGTQASDLRPEVPSWLDEVLTQALAEEPWKRWQSAREMADKLKQGSKRRRSHRPTSTMKRRQVPESQAPSSHFSRAVSQLGPNDWATAAIEFTGEFVCLFIALFSFLRPGLFWPPEMTDTLTALVGVISATIALFIPIRRLYKAATAPRTWPPPGETAPTQNPSTTIELVILGMVVCSGIFAMLMFFGFLAYLSDQDQPGTPSPEAALTSATATLTDRATATPFSEPSALPTDTHLPTTTAVPLTPTDLPSETLPPSTVAPTPSDTPSATIEPTTPTKAATTAAPTKKPPTATPKPPTATVPATTYPAPTPISPADGDSFQGPEAQVVFRWTSVGELAADDYYVVVIPHSQDADGHEEWTKATTWDQTGWLYNYTLPDRQFTWYVVVKRNTGTTDSKTGPEVGPRSATQHFYWYDQGDGPTQLPDEVTPPVVTPPGP